MRTSLQWRVVEATQRQGGECSTLRGCTGVRCVMMQSVGVFRRGEEGEAIK